MSQTVAEEGTGTAALVSVVVPAFNAAKTLAEALDSILSQSYPNIEIVVVDDGSTDETEQVLARYGDSLQVVHQANTGLPGARNAGCHLARGEFIALMDADDLCAPERIAVQVQAMQRHPDAVLCCSDFSAFDGNGQVSESHGATYYSQIGDARDGLSSLFPHRESLRARLSFSASVPAGNPVEIDTHFGSVYRDLAFGNFVHPPTVMFRAETLRTAGMFDETIRYNSDWECFVRMSRLGAVVHLARPLLAYRLSDSQMSSSRGNRGRGALDLVHASAKIWRSDPDLQLRDAARMRSCQREFYSNAARALVADDKLMAAKMLAASVWCGSVNRDAVSTAIKLLLPQWLIGLVRRKRQMPGG